MRYQTILTLVSLIATGALSVPLPGVDSTVGQVGQDATVGQVGQNRRGKLLKSQEGNDAKCFKVSITPSDRSGKMPL